MTTSFDSVRTGDRVRLTAVNGDLAEFTVVNRAESPLGGGVSLYSEGNLYSEDRWNHVEVLQPKLPTEPGWYEAVGTFPMGGKDANAPYRLDSTGQWSSADRHSKFTDETMRTLGKLVKLGSLA